MSTTAKLNIAAIWLVFAGILWASVLVFMYLALGAIAEPISAAYTWFYSMVMFAGPLLLIISTFVVLKSRYHTLGALFALAGACILTALVAYDSRELFHVDALQAPPPYGIYAGMYALTLVTDVAAIILYRHRYGQATQSI
jgi:hypothetical protein